MSKSVLPIVVMQPTFTGSTVGLPRTIEVPCRFPESFSMRLAAFGTTLNVVAYVNHWDDPSAASIGDVELVQGPDVECEAFMREMAEAVLERAKARLGLVDTGHSANYEPLPSIALAYEAEVAAYDAAVKAHAALPRALHSPALLKSHPADRDYRYKGDAALLLAAYVTYVFEQACLAQTERAETQSKVTP